jgi:hypothetical protein
MMGYYGLMFGMGITGLMFVALALLGDKYWKVNK